MEDLQIDEVVGFVLIWVSSDEFYCVQLTKEAEKDNFKVRKIKLLKQKNHFSVCHMSRKWERGFRFAKQKLTY